jgi:pyrimidine operon attenuation protein/uracil phosphoribosyltransferase
MKKKRVIILEKERIAYKLRRMAYEIWEKNSDEQEITLIGIDGGGSILAENLSALVREISPLKVTTLPLKVNKKKLPGNAIDPGMDLNGRTIVLVDDVVSSGKTIFYCLNSLLCYDMKKLMVAVLVDRKHKSFPIASDIVGHTIATTLQDHIVVEAKGNEILAVYLE